MSQCRWAIALSVTAALWCSAGFDLVSACQYQAVWVTKANGKWEDPATWNNPNAPNPPLLPGPNDDVVIDHQVTKALKPNPPPVITDARSVTVNPSGKLSAEKQGEPLDVRAESGISNHGVIETPTNVTPGGSSGDIGLHTNDGPINNDGTIKTGDGANGSPTGVGNGGTSGSIGIDAHGVNHPITNTGTTETGRGGSGAPTTGGNKPGGNGAESGSIKLKADGPIQNPSPGKIVTGPAGAGGSTSGPGSKAGNGAASGKIIVDSDDGTSNGGTIKTGDGGAAGTPTGANSPAGDGGGSGNVNAAGKNKVENTGTIATGDAKDGSNTSASGQKGGAGGKAGDINGGRNIDPSGKADGKTALGNLPGTEHTGKNGEPGNGPAGKGTKPATPNIKILATFQIVLGPSSSITTGLCTLDVGDGALLLTGLQPGAIIASESIELFALGSIDLRGNPAGFDVLQAGSRVRLTTVAPSSLLLDPGVSVGSISTPDAELFLGIWNDGFETYPVGSSVAGQGGWSNWDNAVNFDSVATADESRGDFQALEVKLASDLVHTYSGVSSGRVDLRTFVYTSSQPPGALVDSAWFILLSSYGVPVTSTNTSWAVQVQLDGAAGLWRINAGSPVTASGPLILDSWVELRAEVDLDSDRVEVFYDGVPMAPPYAWTGGIFGGANNPRELAAVDLFAPTSSVTSVAYWDDLSLARGAPGIVTTYCTPKLNSQGCLPSIGWNGASSASAFGGFTVSASNVINNKSGLLFYGTTGRFSAPFQGGTMCVKPPIRRTPVVSSGGSPPPNNCTGVYMIDMNAFAHGLLGGSPLPQLLVPGTTVDCQWWGRDPGFPAPLNTTLSEGLEYVVQL